MNDTETLVDHFGELGRGDDWWTCPCGIVLATHLDDARTRRWPHIQQAHERILAARVAAAHPCANYRAPLTCLTAPSSESGRCDWCAGVVAAAHAEMVADLDDALCGAYMAAVHGSYDGRTAQRHIERPLDRLRAAVADPEPEEGQ